MKETRLIQILSVGFAILCMIVLLAGAAWFANLPVPNGSFESTSNGFPAGGWQGGAAAIQSVAIPNAADGARVLRMDTTLGTTYMWGPAYGSGMPYQVVGSNSLYTLKIKAMKVPGYTNNGGWMRLLIVPIKGQWDTVYTSTEVTIPAQTQDGVWTEYETSFCSGNYPNPDNPGSSPYYAGAYFIVQLYTNAGGQIYYDDIRLDGVPVEIGGTITLGDWAPADPDKRLTPVKIELIPQGSGTAKTEVVVLDLANKYSTICDPGTYNVTFSAAGWLKKMVPGVVVSSTQAVCDAVLIGGDVDGNNCIGTADFGILSSNFDLVGD